MDQEKLAAQMAERKEQRKEIKKKKGRPTKAAIKAKSRGSRGVMGRPKGDAAIINEYKARMLSSPKSAKVLEAIFDAALNDEHKNQGAAWKLIVDRIAPTSAFEQDVVKGGGRNAIQINISGIGETKEPEVIDVTPEVIDV